LKQDKDRQTQTRTNFPDTLLLIKQTQSLINRFTYKGKNEIVNLSKSGAGIISTLRFKKGETIKLKIKFPGEKDLILLGNIKWTNKINGNGTYRSGIQFHPFSDKGFYNSLDSLKRLNSLNK
jgi:hypothetical protein